jgi:transcriptional regulator with XRE-family HTH domain
VEKYSKRLYYYSDSTSSHYRSTNFWDNTIIETNYNIKEEDCTKDIDYLKYYRIKYGLTYNKIATSINYGTSELKSIEEGKKLLTRDVSQRLAKYFNTGTVYFYNTYYEETHNFYDTFIEYLNKERMIDIHIKTGISYAILRSWKKGESRPNYEHYLILKKYNIL